MSEKKSKYVKVGAVMKGASNNYIILGNTKSKTKKYQYNVEMIVTDADGNELARLKNGLLSTFNPRKKEGVEDVSRIPENLLAEVFIVQN